MENAHARAPKQSRSRQSFDRVLDAAAELLAAGGVQALTIAEVSRRSRVSVGSIYCRVESKDALIRAVQARVLQQMDQEFSGIINRIRRRALKLAELVPTLVREQALFLKRHAPLLNAFIERAPHDPVVRAVGRKYHQQFALDFRLLLLERHNEFRHPDPEHAAATCHTIVFGALARYLGFGGGPEVGEGEGDWKHLIEDLGLMTLAFLATDLTVVVRQSATVR